MPINTQEIIKLCAELSAAEDLKVTVKETAKGACIVGGSAFAGGLLGGPVGLALGGTFGSFVALAYGKGKYRSAVDVILFDMTPAQHEQLANSIQTVFNDLRIEDFTVLLPLVMADLPMKELIIKEIIGFLRQEMNLTITR